MNEVGKDFERIAQAADTAACAIAGDFGVKMKPMILPHR